MTLFEKIDNMGLIESVAKLEALRREVKHGVQFLKTVKEREAYVRKFNAGIDTMKIRTMEEIARG